MGRLADVDLSLKLDKDKQERRQAPATVLNALSILRRVCNLAVRDELIIRNPASRLGEIMRRVDRMRAGSHSSKRML